tara:strand:- start:52 stop:669 length:618 start_codon:yes stop_codon:yes gene_type:complete
MKKTNKDADLSLVRRVKKGDYRSFDLLVLKYQSRVIALSNKYVHDHHLAEDIAQETFVKAFKSINSFREESAFYTWLYRIAANTCKNYLSSKKRSKEQSESEMLSTGQDKLGYLDIPGADSPEEILEAKDLREVILTALSSLPEDIRSAISLREFDNLSYEEISDIIGCPVGTVRSRIFRGREVILKDIETTLNAIKIESVNKEG